MRYNIKLAIAISLLSAAQSVQAGPLRWGANLVERQATETPERSSASGEAELTGVPSANTTTYAPTTRTPETTTIINTASAADHENGRRPGNGSKDGSEEDDTAGKPALETLSNVPELDDSLKSFIDDDGASSSEYIPDPDLTTIDIIGPSTTEEKSSATSSSETTPTEIITSEITPSETPISENPTSVIISDTTSETTSSTSEKASAPPRQPTGFPENTPSGIDEDITKPITQTQFLPPTPTDDESTTETPSSISSSETTVQSSESFVEPPAASDERGTPATTLTPSPEKTTQSSENSTESTTTKELSTVTPPSSPGVPDEGRVGSPSGSPEPPTSTEVVTTGSAAEPPPSLSTSSTDEEAPIETPIETPPVGEAPDASTSSSTTVESEIETPSEPAPTSTASSTSIDVPEIPVGEITSSSSAEAPGSTTVEITITSGKEVPTADEPKQPSFTPVPRPSDGPEEPAQPKQPSPSETTDEPEEPVQPTTYEHPAPPSTSAEEVEPTTTVQATSTSSTTLTVSLPPGANPEVPTALPPPTLTTSLSPQQSSANLQQARQINDLYGTLSPSTPCFDGQYACVNGKVAECKGETFDISSCNVEGERCFALPAKEMEGVMVGCWDEAYAMAVLSGFGERYSKTATPPKETKGEDQGGDNGNTGETFTQSIELPSSTAAKAQPTEQPAPPNEKAPPASTQAPAPPPANSQPRPDWLSSGESLFLTINPNPDGTTTIIAGQAAPTGEDSALRTTQTVDGVPTVSVISTVTVTQAAVTVTVTEAAVTVTEPAVTVTVTATVGGAGERVEQITVSDFAEDEVVDLGMAP